MPPVVLLVAAGGAAGALARFGLGEALPATPSGLPVATLLANLLGCLLLGLLVGRYRRHPVLRPLLGTGVLGGFTTFSTLALQTDRLLDDRPAVALGYLAATTAGGLLLAAAGLRLGSGR
ncbi:MAG: CrcB protein [Frankiales bacterium]|nr:CrcB protein [Frankiales bacterium]